MSAKPLSLLSACLSPILILMLVLSFEVTPVAAQRTPPAEECGCRTCHEQQYYLYDTGKWYCLCKALMTCVHCHAGDGLESTADLAHTGMRIYPFENEAAVCRSCHSTDSQDRVNKFIELAGAGHVPISAAQQPSFPTAAPQPFPETAASETGIWEWFGIALMAAIAVWMFILWRR